jgi:hypothetical protein
MLAKYLAPQVLQTHQFPTNTFLTKGKPKVTAGNHYT